MFKVNICMLSFNTCLNHQKKHLLNCFGNCKEASEVGKQQQKNSQMLFILNHRVPPCGSGSKTD